jgi:PAS domain S-box-containing protein
MTETDGCLKNLGRLTRVCWLATRRWLVEHTFSPAWLPRPLRHPIVSYLLAALLPGAIAALDLLIAQRYPSFTIQRLPFVLAVVVIALYWGLGPSLVATCVGTFLMYYVVLTPHFTWAFETAEDIIGVFLLLLSSLAVASIASHRELARRKAEELAVSLRQERASSEMERQRLRAVLDVLPAGVGIADEQGRILELNAAFRVIWGQESPLVTELVRYDLYKGWRPDTGEPIAADEWALARALRKGEVYSGEEAEIETIDGQRKVVLNSAAPILNDAGDVAGAVVAMIDITERKRLEQRTQEALDALLNMAETLVAREDAARTQATPSAASDTLSGMARRLAELTCRVLDCQRVSILSLEPETGNIHAITTVGLSPEQEQPWLIALPQGIQLSERVQPEMAARLRAGETLLFDLTLPPWSSLPAPLRARALLLAPMLLGEQLMGYLALDHGSAEHEYTPQELALTGAVAKLVTLVIERERLLYERAEAQANMLALAEANRRMDEFLGIASHELRTPLTTIRLHFQLAQRRIDALRSYAVPAEVVARELERLQEQFRRAHIQTGRLDRLVNDLLDVSRIQAGRLELRKTPEDLMDIVNETIDEQRQLAPNRVIQFQGASEQRVMVFVDGERIRQVVTNYLTNALKYSREDQPVTVGLQADEQDARVWVRDEGPGIPLPEQAHIWERFHRVPGIEVQSGSGIGLGLGLHICRTIIEWHGGQVGLESAPGAGATFWFSLSRSSPALSPTERP